MSLLRPQPEIDLVDVLSTDTVEDLLNAYIRNYKRLFGKTISDIATVSEKLRQWTPIDVADSIIPFKFGRQSKEPVGYRIWYLSQKPNSLYYNGWFFDYQISVTGSRKIRRNCKLSDNALALFDKYPDIKKYCIPKVSVDSALKNSYSQSETEDDLSSKH